MKRLGMIAVLLLICIAFPTPSAARNGVKRYMTKETTVDMKNMNKVCVGWIDLGAENWVSFKYTQKDAWVTVINSLNTVFVGQLQSSYLPGRTIVAAKSKDDTSAAGCDLNIKFSDVTVDYNDYHLILSIYFIDPKTGAEIGSIPARPYYGNSWGLEGFLNEALKEVGTKLRVEVSGGR
jgi:hypothetical protein